MDKFVDWFMDFLYGLASIAIGWLPNSPFQTEDFQKSLTPYADVMAQINYFVPVGTCLVITTAYVTAVGVWYVARWILRLVKYID